MIIRKLILLFFSFSILLSACDAAPPAVVDSLPTTTPTLPFSEPTPVTPQITSENVLKIGWQDGPDSINPFVSQWGQSFTIFDLIYSSLYKLNPDGALIPDAVASVAVSDDSRVWTFQIYPNIKFHDGNVLTSRDVVFSLNLYNFPGEIVAMDDTTVRITFVEPIPNVEGHLLFRYIFPQHVWARYENSPTSFDNASMIGSGPFRLVNYQANTFVHLASVEEHFRYAPKVDEVIYQVFENENMLVEAILTGEVDMIDTLPYADLVKLSNTPNVSVKIALPLYPTFEEIILNQIAPENCPVEAGGICSGHPALRDKTVRLAMAHALDKSKLIEEVLAGAGDPGISMIPTGLKDLFNTSIKDYPYNPNYANQLLDEGGYLDSDGDGIREMPSDAETDANRPLVFRFNYLGPSVLYQKLGTRLSESWANIGIELEIQEMDSIGLLNVCCPAFDYDVLIWTWDVNPDPGNILTIMETSQIPTSYNETGYTNPEYDILAAVQHTEIDPEKREQIIWELQRIAHRDVVHIVLYYAQSVQAYRTDRFTGWITEASHLALEDFSNVISLEPVK